MFYLLVGRVCWQLQGSTSGPLDPKIIKWSLPESPAGDHVFAVSADGTVRQFEVKENKEVHQFKGHSDWPLSIDFHEARSRIASGGYDGEVRIWAPDQTDAIVTFSAAP